MALHLASRIHGPEIAQAIQLGIEYDPQPPFDTGTVAKAGNELTELDEKLFLEVFQTERPARKPRRRAA